MLELGIKLVWYSGILVFNTVDSRASILSTDIGSFIFPVNLKYIVETDLVIFFHHLEMPAVDCPSF